MSLSSPHNRQSQTLKKNSYDALFPQVNQVKFHLPPSSSSAAATGNPAADPFFLQYDAIRSSCHLLPPLLASVSPPLSAFVYDVMLISPALSVANILSVPQYLFFISSATMLSFFSYFPTVAAPLPGPDVVEIPGVSAIPRSSIPPQLLDPSNIFSKIFMEDSQKLTKLHGFLVNTFEELEGETLEALNCGRVGKELPPIYAIGPLVPHEFEKIGQREHQ